MPEFLVGTTSFIARAISVAEPVLVLLTGDRLAALRREVGAGAPNLTFADMAEVGGNPARLTTVWRRFADTHAGREQLYGIGEPIYPGRSPAEITECQLYEKLLNAVFDAAAPLRLLCPYDLAALPAGVVDEAHRSHPFVTIGGRREPSGAFRPFEFAEAFGAALEPRPADAPGLSFRPGELNQVRVLIAGQATRARLGQRTAAALVTSVNEIATNSLQHGGGHGDLHVWSDGSALLCEVTDAGRFSAPLAGRLPPGPRSGGGLWLANQFCDLVQIRSSARGTTVRVHQKLTAAADHRPSGDGPRVPSRQAAAGDRSAAAPASH